jgi:hypothetical protein
MRAFALLLFVLPLAGCKQDQEKQLAACKLESMRLYEEPLIPDAFDVLPYHKYIKTCMAAKGYGMTVLSDRCVVGVDFSIQVECYKPTGRLERLLFNLEEKLNSGGQ